MQRSCHLVAAVFLTAYDAATITAFRVIAEFRTQEFAALIARAQDADALHRLGVGPTRQERADVDTALEGVPESATHLLLIHNPTSSVATDSRRRGPVAPR